ncbi:hypothetical protein [Tenacibaculum litopenaei]|uniref:hypothetical protein n=1 Tax=Tenacibaculum litopenaei TaxID=396016 RepID=UPI0038B4DEA3
MCYHTAISLLGLLKQVQQINNHEAETLVANVYDEENKLSRVTDSANKTFGFKDGTHSHDDFG